MVVVSESVDYGFGSAVGFDFDGGFGSDVRFGIDDQFGFVVGLVLR